MTEPTDEMVKAAHKALMAELFGACQPDRGDVFGFMDDRPELMRAVLRAALSTFTKGGADADK